MKHKPGLLMVLSGPSGAGKGTIVRELLNRYADMEVSVSMTTREPRPGEVNGEHYYFVTREQFEQAIAEEGLLEYAEYNGNYYGTPIAPVQKMLDEGKNVILEIDVQGAEKVMKKRPELVSIFIGTPSMTELERRLRGRGTETEEVIEKRLAAAHYELSCARRYQYVVLNDEVAAACDRIKTIIDAENMRSFRVNDTIWEVN